MAYTKLISRHTRGAQVEKFLLDNQGEREAYRLSIPAGSANRYRLAQLDDYTQRRRGQFPWSAPSTALGSSLTLSLSARTSSESIPGTWGFGLWNDPFGLSLGLGGNPWRLPALPNAVWFFGASEESYLSFKSEQPQGSAPTFAANGFLAQTFRSPRFHALLIPAGLVLPFSRKTTRRLLGKVIDEDGIDLSRRRSPLAPPVICLANQADVASMDVLEGAAYTGLEVTEWHKYKLDWYEDQVAFEVDGAQVFESTVSPHPPLGLVIWIDNQYAAFTPEGKIGFGVLENSEPAWLEVKEIEMVRNARSDPHTDELVG